MSKVKEMYETDGICPGIKYLLTIMDDDSVTLTFYNGSFKKDEPNVEIIAIGDNGGKRVEYGTVNVKSSFPFRRYSDGTLDERWTRIK